MLDNNFAIVICKTMKNCRRFPKIKIMPRTSNFLKRTWEQVYYVQDHHSRSNQALLTMIIQP